MTVVLCFTLIAGLTGCGKGEKKAEFDMKSSLSGGIQSMENSMQFDVADGGEYGIPQEPLQELHTEEYSSIDENRFLAVKNQPLSTFSADVDTASYANVRRILRQGGAVDSGAVRIEEMINYFHYDYDPPQGNTPFSVSAELADCPWNTDTKLLSIGIQAKELSTEGLPASNLVFLLDVSGSMYNDNKLPLMVTAFKMLLENLTASDRISIVTYAGKDEVLLEGADGSNSLEIATMLDELTADGSTNGADGIETAYTLAEKYFIQGGNNRVILATDGDLNVGLSSESDLKRLVEEKRKSGVFLSVLGFGTGNLKDNKLETIADAGNGNYSYIDSVLEAKKVLVEEMGGTLFTVAKDVKFQVEFNPQNVKGYRLIGYENRLLQTEDFEDDTKDAGEIGAGHRLTVLYEVVPVDSPMEIQGTDLKYQQESETTDLKEEWMTVNIRYKEPESEKSTLISKSVTKADYQEVPSENLRFAACVAEFGMLLRESKYKGTSSYEKILQELRSLKSVAADAYKSEFCELVSLASRTAEKLD